jgi:hypothetical protein
MTRDLRGASGRISAVVRPCPAPDLCSAKLEVEVHETGDLIKTRE